MNDGSARENDDATKRCSVSTGEGVGGEEESYPEKTSKDLRGGEAGFTKKLKKKKKKKKAARNRFNSLQMVPARGNLRGRAV